ncbi:MULTISPECIES: DNA polymerase III subunit gamma and tau [Microbacterium]|uniref:DNA polymerase III subunit gamma/tau n=1 Tax=Microbacterium wangchenii TaxID=2541726 RepID=A0ABX5STX4_9MICO|nr:MULTISPECIES: DNA polymerase III subunit gamma and tau [Microbacterium]MCK6067454.1 DNA polymerase III subunit gamma and tau [Microbacterium sp. EYE_512]QBR89611.1 DNA polymerase III subunit gamma and tau [Microbacterium wangchenii]TXK16790.1 DNA polymerase III subunit gamma and tau [Microbacterium wangchenii]
MTTALYRRYRPEAFGEMIGQSQVTDPLMTALRSDRVGHAYLFSGPRGCGKTTSARILARCLNCAAGPTDTPCGTCDSCVELGRGGGGSLDVVEIDAASHNGVDDARDLRERAIFAPARDRFKIFILDEAHMVTQQGFNALLKLVEEPPEHVKFIFATTEPEKVLGTIRSRTHHYPFRLVPPAAMLEYVQELCQTEGVEVEPGVLPLVVRAGGGSPRDTLSLLDQLIAGSDVSDGPEGVVTVRYERAVALLGYTHAELLDEVVEAFGQSDPAGAFAAVDRVVQTGQDPRRFVDDLLERLRDLIVIAATGQGASAVLRGVPTEELERMGRQAALFGADRLSRTADLVVAALDEMTGATSPRLQLELLVARVLARTAAPASSEPPAPAAPAPPANVHQPGESAPDTVPVRRDDALSAPATPINEPAPPEPETEPEPEFAPPAPSGPFTAQRMRDAWPEILARLEELSRSSWLLASGARVLALDDDVLTLSFASQSDLASFKKRGAGTGPSEDLRQAILGVLGIRVKFIARHDGDGPGGTGPGAPEPSPPAPESVPPAPETAPPAPERRPAAAAAAPVTEWAVAPIPSTPPADAPAPPSALSAAVAAQFAVDDEPEDAAPAARPVATLARVREGDVLPDGESGAVAPDDAEDIPAPEAPRDVPVPPVVAPRITPARGGVQRYGEAVVRQVLGATFVREEPHQAPTRFA